MRAASGIVGDIKIFELIGRSAKVKEMFFSFTFPVRLQQRGRGRMIHRGQGRGAFRGHGRQGGFGRPDRDHRVRRVRLSGIAPLVKYCLTNARSI
jgi:hypothetical protein